MVKKIRTPMAAENFCDIAIKFWLSLDNTTMPTELDCQNFSTNSCALDKQGQTSPQTLKSPGSGWDELDGTTHGPPHNQRQLVESKTPTRSE